MYSNCSAVKPFKPVHFFADDIICFMHALIMSEKSHHHYVLKSVTLWNKRELHLLIMQIRDYFCLIFNLSRGTFKFTPVPNVLLCFRVERHVSWKRVQRCATFSLVWWVCQKCQPNQQQHVYKPSSFKDTARTMSPSEVIYKCAHCSSVYATIEDIRRHDCLKSFIET